MYVTATLRPMLICATFSTELVVQITGVVVAFIGLGGVVISLKLNREQQRTQNGPYVRVDIGISHGIEDQKDISETYYQDSSQIADLSEDSSASTEISAWFRNYQLVPLGFALGVRATFLVQSKETRVVDVEIPYLEYKKTVRVGLVLVPAEGDVSVTLSSLTFYDFYDQRYVHVYGQKSTNALHGRLVWARTSGFSESTPEGRSRGHGVDYNVGAY